LIVDKKITWWMYQTIANCNKTMKLTDLEVPYTIRSFNLSIIIVVLIRVRPFIDEELNG